MKHINIYPRQTGKTTKLLETLYEYMQCGQQVIVVCDHEAWAKRLKREFTKKYERHNANLNEIFVGVHSLVKEDSPLWRSLLFRAFYEDAVILIDEYLLFSPENKKALWKILKGHKKDIKSYTTSDMLYNKDLLAIVRAFKEGAISSLSFLNEETQEIVDKHYLYNFITDPDCHVYSIYELKKLLVDKETLEIQYLGKYIED